MVRSFILFFVERTLQIAHRLYDIWDRAPFVAQHVQAGQFAMFRTDEKGEPIPLTISAVDVDSIRVVFLAPGKIASRRGSLRHGNPIKDGAGTLGKHRVIRHRGTCERIGQGVGAGSKSIERVIPQYYSTEDATWERST
jgi:ferredoxin--NADP+ reductase